MEVRPRHCCLRVDNTTAATAAADAARKCRAAGVVQRLLHMLLLVLLLLLPGRKTFVGFATSHEGWSTLLQFVVQYNAAAALPPLLSCSCSASPAATPAAAADALLLQA